jgi:hypothetical protein
MSILLPERMCVENAGLTRGNDMVGRLTGGDGSQPRIDEDPEC